MLTLHPTYHPPKTLPIVSRFHKLEKDIVELREKAPKATGKIGRIMDRRLENKELELLTLTEALAQITLEEEKRGGDEAKYRPLIVEKLEQLPNTLLIRISNLLALLAEKIEASTNATGKGLVALVDSRIRLGKRMETLYQKLLETRPLSQAYGIDTTAQDAKLRGSLSLRAERISIALDIAHEDMDSLTFQADQYPDDKELAAALNMATTQVEVLADTLHENVEMMLDLNIDTDLYEQQLIVARGAITLDIFDPDVLLALVKNWGSGVTAWLGEQMPQALLNLLIFVLIMLVFSRLAVLAKKVVAKSFEASKLNISQLLRDLAISAVKNIVLLIGFLIALGQMGISVGPVLAGLGVAGFVIGFALQDTLSNFASGMMILVYRPFDVGDTVEIGDVYGIVKAMNMVNTTILTFDNQTLILPNTKIWQAVIKNVTAQKIRRVDLIFGISYSDDILKAEKLLSDILEEHDHILEDPEPMIRLHELGDSSVNFVVRPWVETDYYWDVYWDIIREVKLRFDREGITIPFPQRDVHIIAASDKDEKHKAESDKMLKQDHAAASATTRPDDMDDGGDD